MYDAGSDTLRIEQHEKADFPISIYHLSGSGDGVLEYHCHGDFEILHIREGCGVFQIGPSSYPVKSGDVLFVNPYEVHSGTSEKDTVLTYDAIVYERQLLEAITLHPDYHRYIRPLLENRHGFPHTLSKKAGISNRVTSTIHEILTEYHEKTAGYEWMIRTNLEKIAVLLYRYLHESEESTSHAPLAATGRDFAELFRTVSENPATQISTEKAAGMVRTSRYHFCRKFKAYTGKTFIEFLHLFRVGEAEHLLLETELPVSEIAEAVGFGNLPYFDRVFKSVKGLSPNQYRTKKRNILP